MSDTEEVRETAGEATDRRARSGSTVETDPEALRIGVLGLDTSHADTFADELDASDEATIAAVWDGNAVREPSYAPSFADEYGATRYDDPVAMVDAVDAAMVLTVNWDSHRDLAVPFLDAGIPTFVDKVVAGRVGDVEAMADAAGDTPLFGGSSIPFHPAVAELPTASAERTLYAAGYNDPFYYGVHVVDTVRSIADVPWTRVAPLAGPSLRVEVTFADGSRAILQFDGKHNDPAFGFLDVAERTRTARIGMGEGYGPMRESFFDAFLATVRGERDDAERVLNAATLQLAVHAALDTGEAIAPDDATLREYHADGTAYATAYATDKPSAIDGSW